METTPVHRLITLAEPMTPARLAAIRARVSSPERSVSGSNEKLDAIALLVHVDRLLEEIEVLRRYGNDACTDMADEALAEKRATGKGPWED